MRLTRPRPKVLNPFHLRLLLLIAVAFLLGVGAQLLVPDKPKPHFASSLDLRP